MKKTLLFLCISAVVFAVEITSFKTEGNTWNDAFEAAQKADRCITIPGGKYVFDKALEVKDNLTIEMLNGAELTTAVSPLIYHTGGVLVIEASGMPGILSCTAHGERGNINPNRCAVIDLNEPSGDNPPSLKLRNIEFRSFNGIDGYWAKSDALNAMRKTIANVEIDRCRFLCSEKGIGFKGMVIESARIENSYFNGCDQPILMSVPMPGGIQVVNNELHDFGRCGMLLGKAGQVSDGCTTHLTNAIVRGNRLLKGGRGAKVSDSYIQGILVYGHNVIVEGNVIVDVNRGIPVPGEPIGHQMVSDDGKPLRGHWIERNGKRVRMAGAAIYLKANRSLVMGNICTNSGYRSVIEVKTGGKEPFVSICNNVVDGRALDIDESFGFECNSGRSVWMNNVVYDMPNQAFVVRSGFENTFMNNLIINAKVGFALSGKTPGQGEWISNNRFIDVKIPVAIDGKVLREANIPEAPLSGPVYLSESAELPAASSEWRGRMLVKGKSAYICIEDKGVCKWMEFDGGKVLEPKKYIPVGPELAFNSDQSGTETSSNPELNDPAFPGWKISMRTATEKVLDPHDGFVTFDTKNFKTGKRSMKVLFPEHGSEWSARQTIGVTCGKRYRATALVKGEEPRNFRLCVTCGQNSAQMRGEETQEWQLLSVDFIAKAETCVFQVLGAKTSPGKASWVDSISLRELMDENAEPPKQMEPVGEELIKMPQLKENGWLAAGWGVSGIKKIDIALRGTELVLTANEKGNLLVSTGVKLKAGTYRYMLTFKQDAAKCKQSVKLYDGSRPAGVRIAADTYQCDFTMEKEGNVTLGLWGGLEPGETVSIVNVSLKSLLEKAK